MKRLQCASVLFLMLLHSVCLAATDYYVAADGNDENSGLSATEAKATIAAVKQLSKDVGIPADLKGILKEEDVQFLSESAFADACCPGNPRDTSVEEIAALYRSMM